MIIINNSVHIYIDIYKYIIYISIKNGTVVHYCALYMYISSQFALVQTASTVRVHVREEAIHLYIS